MPTDPAPEKPMSERERFLWQRSVEISAFEAQTADEDAALWQQALADADRLFGPAEESER